MQENSKAEMAVTIDGLPVYNATIPDAECGMMCISIVDDPAVQSDFVAFDRHARPLLYAVQDEERRMVRGVVMRADFPIYRNQPPQGEFYVIYKAETIRLMAEKYLSENRQNLVNTMHKSDTFTEGVQMVEFFIKDTAAGLSPEGFEGIADGSLFAVFHINDDAIWEEIKAGTYKGFSLEGLFSLEPEQDRNYVRDAVDSLDGLFARLFKQKDMNDRLKKFKTKLAALMGVLFASTTTDKGVLEWDGDDDLKAGDSVYSVDESGERKPAGSGDYRTDDGKVIKVMDGKVTEITDDAAEVEGAEEDVEGPDGNAESDSKGIEELRKEVNELYELVDKILDAMGSSRDDIQKMRSEVEKLKKAAKAHPAHEEYNEVKIRKTGNARLDRLAEMLGK